MKLKKHKRMEMESKEVKYNLKGEPKAKGERELKYWHSI